MHLLFFCFCPDAFSHWPLFLFSRTLPPPFFLDFPRESLFFFVICNFYWTQSRKVHFVPAVMEIVNDGERQTSLRKRSHLMLLAKDRVFLLSCLLPPTCSQFSSLLPPEGPHLLINSASLQCLLLHAQKDTCFPSLKEKPPFSPSGRAACIDDNCRPLSIHM